MLHHALKNQINLKPLSLNVGQWNNTGLEHIKLGFLQKYTFTLKQDRIKKY
jgi:hypothetical protein